MRLHCLHHGLFLSGHALHVRFPDRPLLLRDDETGESVRVPAEGEPVPAVVPYKYVSTARDILYLLAGGTDAFEGLLDPRQRCA